MVAVVFLVSVVVGGGMALLGMQLAHWAENRRRHRERGW